MNSNHDDSAVPCTFIYADPLPFVKTIEPLVVSTDSKRDMWIQLELALLVKSYWLTRWDLVIHDQYLSIGNSNSTAITKWVAVKLLKSSASAEVKRPLIKRSNLCCVWRMTTECYKIVGISYVQPWRMEIWTATCSKRNLWILLPLLLAMAACRGCLQPPLPAHTYIPPSQEKPNDIYLFHIK